MFPKQKTAAMEIMTGLRIRNDFFRISEKFHLKILNLFLATLLPILLKKIKTLEGS